MRCPARPAIMMVVGKPRRRTTARLTNHASSSVTDSTSVHGMNNDGLPSRNGEENRQEESFATDGDEQCSSILDRPRGRSDPTRDKAKALPVDRACGPKPPGQRSPTGCPGQHCADAEPKEAKQHEEPGGLQEFSR